MHEFPEEIFKEVISHYVTMVGVAKAWKTRGVCKAFNKNITEEIWKRQPDSAFLASPGAKRLLKNGHRAYLEHRSITLGGDRPALAININQATDVIMGFMTPAHTPMPVIKDTVRKRVVHAVTQWFPFTYRMVTERALWSDWAANLLRQLEKDSPMQYALCTAIDWLNEDLIQYLLANGACVWLETRVFRSPLKVAVDSGELRIVTPILHHAGLHRNHITRKVQLYIIARLLRTMDSEPITAPGRPLRKEVLRWCLDTFDRPSAEIRKILCGWAIQLPDPRYLVVLAQLNMRWTTKEEDFARQYFCFKPTPQVLHTLLSHQVLDPRKAYHFTEAEIDSYPAPYKHHLKSRLYTSSHGFSTSILDHAVSHACLAVVRKALELGAPVDGVFIDGKLSYPIRQRKHTHPTDHLTDPFWNLLVQHGAVPFPPPRDNPTQG